jgi:hypothetical protein
MSHNNGQIENFQLRRLIELAETNVRQNHRLISIGELHTRQNHRIIRLLALIASEVEPPFLDSIQIRFERNNMPTPGPVTLTAVGQQVTASVVGFDQFGQPFTGELPPATLSSDDTAGAIVTFDPSTGLTTAVADGVANITANLTTAEGVALSDTEAVTVAITPPPTPVLSSIKVAF